MAILSVSLTWDPSSKGDPKALLEMSMGDVAQLQVALSATITGDMPSFGTRDWTEELIKCLSDLLETAREHRNRSRSPGP